MKNVVFVYKYYSTKPESKDFCFFEIITCDKAFAKSEIDKYCQNNQITPEDYYVRKFVKGMEK